jgi:hypothetical protein
VHTHTFRYIVESLGLDEGELFNMHRKVPSITNKAAWALKHTRHLDDPDFKTGTPVPGCRESILEAMDLKKGKIRDPRDRVSKRRRTKLGMRTSYLFIWPQMTSLYNASKYTHWIDVRLFIPGKPSGDIRRWPESSATDLPID